MESQTFHGVIDKRKQTSYTTPSLRSQSKHVPCLHVSHIHPRRRRTLHGQPTTMHESVDNARNATATDAPAKEKPRGKKPARTSRQRHPTFLLLLFRHPFIRAFNTGPDRPSTPDHQTDIKCYSTTIPHTHLPAPTAPSATTPSMLFIRVHFSPSRRPHLLPLLR